MGRDRVNLGLKRGDIYFLGKLKKAFWVHNLRSLHQRGLNEGVSIREFVYVLLYFSILACWVCDNFCSLCNILSCSFILSFILSFCVWGGASFRGWPSMCLVRIGRCKTP